MDKSGSIAGDWRRIAIVRFPLPPLNGESLRAGAGSSGISQSAPLLPRMRWDSAARDFLCFAIESLLLVLELHVSLGGCGFGTVDIFLSTSLQFRLCSTSSPSCLPHRHLAQSQRRPCLLVF